MSEPRIVTERRGHVFWIGLDRAAKLNAFDRQMLTELSDAVTAYEADPDLWCAVLYPTGPNFTSGLDLADVGPAVARGELLFSADQVDPLGLFGKTRTKPLIHAARGYCLTIGTELALASDICIAAPDTRYGQIEVKRGIMPFGGATLRMHQIAGWGNAMRYLLTGDLFDAAEAFRIGLVQVVAGEDDLLDQAAAMAARVARQAPLAVQASLQSAQVARDQGFAAAVEQMMPQARALMATEDAAEGMRSFVERREADFKGR
ncbi:MAG: crotonase/enoyl-CoA hydratase family protein [Myxococcota bacterium]